MNRVTVDIWGRSLELEIVYDVYPGEAILKEQEKAFTNFMKASPALLELAETEVKKYCLANNKEDIGTSEITNIFKYVKPKAIYIKREDGADRVIALLCAYKFNPDDGLAVVFKNESLYQIGTENIIL